MTIYSVLRKVWSLWNIRIAVLSSLGLQIVLIFLSPLRKRTRGIWIHPIIWLCYLMADWVAAYSIGVIVNHSRCSCDDGNGVDRDLAAFWAPFLLLHLGGPDTITAFSIEDNTLWMRHFLSMIVEVTVVFYVLSLAIPSNVLWLPLLLVFVAGTIKYAERTLALYLACYGNINESWSRANSMKKNGAPRKDSEPDKDSESDKDRAEEYLARVKDHMDVFLQAAYHLYKISRKIIYRKMFTKDEYHEGRKIMDGLDAEKSFNVVAVELSFIYDELFTKMAALHRGRWFSYFLRLICSALIVSAFVIFSTTKKLKVPHKVDITVTYALLVGAISLDFITWIMLVFSDRTIAFLKDRPKASKVVNSIYMKMNSYNPGWCESISQHNFISYCMTTKLRPRTRFDKWFEAKIEYFGLMTTLEELKYKYDRNVSRGLKEFIYNHLKGLSPNDRDDIISSKGKRAMSRLHDDDSSYIILEDEYETSLLFWHTATDLLYYTRDHSHGDDNDCDINHREICKVLSDHMFYLYIMRPSLISVRQGAFFQFKIDYFCDEIRSALDSKELSKQRDVYEKLVAANIEEISDIYSSVDALQSTTGDRDKMWRVLSQVWLEMLIYGAYRGGSGGNAHAQQLAKGGEFITHVWLLMAHFGFTDSYVPQMDIFSP